MASSERLKAAEVLYTRCYNPLDFWEAALPEMTQTQVCVWGCAQAGVLVCPAARQLMCACLQQMIVHACLEAMNLIICVLMSWRAHAVQSSAS